MKRNHFTKTIGTKKSSNVTAQIVCWKCSQSNVTLLVVRDDEGKKTQDYICRHCMDLGFHRPPIGNSSRIPYRYPKDDIKEKHDKTI